MNKVKILVHFKTSFIKKILIYCNMMTAQLTLSANQIEYSCCGPAFIMD